MNPHKWLFTNFDCDCFYVADRGPLIGALSILPEYLRNTATESGAVIDYRDWQIPLGRRFRALKLWFVLRSYGAEGLRHHIREHVELDQVHTADGMEHIDSFVAAHPEAAEGIAREGAAALGIYLDFLGECIDYGRALAKRSAPQGSA